MEIQTYHGGTARLVDDVDPPTVGQERATNDRPPCLRAYFGLDNNDKRFNPQQAACIANTRTH